MPLPIGSPSEPALSRASTPTATTSPATTPAAPDGGAAARTPVLPRALQGDGFDAGGQAPRVRDAVHRLDQFAERVLGRIEDRQTARAVYGGTSPGVQEPVVLGGTLPTIDQQTPDGNGFYANGNANCGPTSMAMIARGDPDATIHGVPVSRMTDAQLVMALGLVGGTDQGGTSPNGEIAMAEALGYQTASAHGGLHPVFIDATLAAGGSVIVNGAVPLPGEDAGHYMVLSGKDASGDYVVNDPWTGQTLTMTPEALDAYLKANPVNGGWSIAVW